MNTAISQVDNKGTWLMHCHIFWCATVLIVTSPPSLPLVCPHELSIGLCCAVWHQSVLS
jgi:hypothetical protein